jgi:hypothetical protein
LFDKAATAAAGAVWPLEGCDPGVAPGSFDAREQQASGISVTERRIHRLDLTIAAVISGIAHSLLNQFCVVRAQKLGIIPTRPASFDFGCRVGLIAENLVGLLDVFGPDDELDPAADPQMRPHPTGIVCPDH